MGSSLIFQFLYINVLNFYYFFIQKIKKTCINVYCNYGSMCTRCFEVQQKLYYYVQVIRNYHTQYYYYYYYKLVFFLIFFLTFITSRDGNGLSFVTHDPCDPLYIWSMTDDPWPLHHFILRMGREGGVAWWYWTTLSVLIAKICKSKLSL